MCNIYWRCGDITWTLLHLKLPETRPFVKHLARPNNKLGTHQMSASSASLYDGNPRGMVDSPANRPVVVCKGFPHHGVITTHYNYVIMGAMASQLTSLMIVYSTVYSGADQRKHQSSASLAFVLRIHRWPVNSPHKWPVTRKMFPLDDVIMKTY